jgi:uncharacterized protein
MAIVNGLLVAQVVHTRHRPKHNHFRYHVYYLCASLADLAEACKLAVMRAGRFGLFSFYNGDHAPAPETPQTWITRQKAQWNLTHADGEVVMLTMPRILGYGFNPVTFWFCLDSAGQLRAVLSEVRNTFGEKHCYWSFHADHQPITPDDWLTAQKIFHVSPFLEVTGHYAFRFAYAEDKIGVWIDYHDAEGLVLSTSLVGKRRALSSVSLLYAFVRYPMVTLKVIALIHYQAIKLMGKGLRYHRKPAAPVTEISQ